MCEVWVNCTFGDIEKGEIVALNKDQEREGIFPDYLTLVGSVYGTFHMCLSLKFY